MWLRDSVRSMFKRHLLVANTATCVVLLSVGDSLQQVEPSLITWRNLAQSETFIKLILKGKEVFNESSLSRVHDRVEMRLYSRLLPCSDVRQASAGENAHARPVGVARDEAHR